MILNIEIPDFNENDGLDVFWDENSKLQISVSEKAITLSANHAALISLAKQMLYFAENERICSGAHIHYDSFFCKDGIEGGYEIILEKIRKTK